VLDDGGKETCWLGGNVFSTKIHVKKFVIMLIQDFSLHPANGRVPTSCDVDPDKVK